MSTAFLMLALLCATVGSLIFSGLTYALRDFSRPRLQEEMERRRRERLYDLVADHAADLVFATAVVRMVFNVLVVVTLLLLLEGSGLRRMWQYAMAVVLGSFVSLFSSVTLPNAIARHLGEPMIASSAGFLNALRIAFAPLTGLMHGIDRLFRRATTTGPEKTESEIIEQEIEEEILSVVEEGEKEGVVDEQEREIIESVIQFRDTTAAQTMTARPDVVTIDVDTPLEEIKRAIEETGLSRLPVCEGSLDKIVGILYARDLIKYVGQAVAAFDVRAAMRPAYFVPETTPLKDLLSNFRLQKVHIAIVLDEYGGTAGVVTIEDVLEELVGDISDEHEPAQPAMLKQVAENIWEADARVYLGELNRTVGLNLPEDQGYDTLAGFVTTTMGRIPEAGAVLEQPGARFTVLDAEPQKVNRVKIELVPAAAVNEETKAGEPPAAEGGAAESQ